MLNRFVGDLQALRRDPISYMEEKLLGQEKPVSVRLGFQPAALIGTPSAMQHVLVNARDNYGKGREQARLRPVLGEGLITATGSRWQASRGALKSSFAGTAMAEGIDLALAALNEEVAILSRSSGPLDLHPLMSRMTLRMVAAALFYIRLDGQERDQAVAAVTTAHARISASLWRAVDVDRWLPTRANRDFQRALSVLDAFAEGVARNMQGPVQLALQDLVDQWPAIIRDEVLTMLVAGFETTSGTASWLAYVLASRPDIVDWLRPEADSQRDLSAATISQRPRTQAFVKEVLRLYPSTWWLAREALNDDEIDGVPVRRGTTILLCPWVLHRQPACWKDPLLFNPERFLEPVPKFCWLPFGAGPRTCIGAQLAMAELTGIASMLVGAFDLTPMSGPIASRRAIGGVTLGTPADGLRVQLTVRHAAQKAA